MRRELLQAICGRKMESTSRNRLCSIHNSGIQKDSFMVRTEHKTKARSASSDPVRIGIIGGSGLYSMPGLKDTRELRVRTPFGAPSDALVVGSLEGRRVAFLARHARGHR